MKPRISILSVDDEQDFLDLSKIYLESEDDRFDVDLATSVDKALQKLKEKKFDIVVSDYLMPGKDGLDLLKTLRKQEDEIPLIIFTGKSREEVAIQALNLGADSYLQKGGNPKAQFRVLAQAIVSEYERKNAEKQFLKSQKERAVILDGITDLIVYYTSPEMKIVWTNKAAAEDTGFTVKELVGRSCYQLWHQRDEPCDNCPVVRTFVTAEPQEDEIVSPDGREWLIKGFPVFGEDNHLLGVVEVTRNISERKQTERELKASEEKFRLLIEKMEEGVVLEDKNGIFSFLNPRAAEILGYTVDELIGKHWSTIVPKDEHEKILGELERRPAGDSGKYETNVLAKDGQRIDVIISATPIFNMDKTFDGVLSVITDISERKHMEEAIRESLGREEFLFTLLKHDLKNKMGVIHGYLTLISKSDLSAKVDVYTSKATSASIDSQYLLEKIGMLREIHQQEELSDISLNSFLKDVIEKYSNSAKEMGIKINYESCSYEVQAGLLLEEMFSNCVENVIKHSRCSTLTISTKEEKEEIIVEIEDDGIGFPEEVLTSLFIRGIRGKNSVGLGIGMYLVKRIAENYGGHVEARNSTLGGAVCVISLKKASAGIPRNS